MNPIENLKDLIVYQSQNNENISVEVLYDNEDFLLTQKSMSKLFEVEVNTINYHLKEIFETHELEENRTIRKIRTVQKEGNREVSREISFYSLDVIIAVGYRVNSKQATDFRIWATNTLKEYIKKGFVLNDELLKNGPKFGKDYFKELLERIRSIRTSERRIWQQITDIFAECSIDYDKDSDTTQREAFQKYTGTAYVNINATLRGIDKSFDVGNRENAKNLHAVLENASLPCESTVYRGMSSNALGKLKKLSDKELIGKVFLDKGFMSTSLESNSAFGGDVILEIHAPAGTHGLYVGHISAAGHYEEEVLFDMNQSMRIDFVTRDKFGRRLLKVTII